MKKLFVHIALTTTTLSFSFYKMKGIYKKNDRNIFSKILKEIELNDIDENKDHYYYVLYDKHTCNMIICKGYILSEFQFQSESQNYAKAVKENRTPYKISPIFKIYRKPNKNFYRDFALKFLEGDFDYKIFYNQKIRNNTNNKDHFQTSISYKKMKRDFDQKDIFNDITQYDLTGELTTLELQIPEHTWYKELEIYFTAHLESSKYVKFNNNMDEVILTDNKKKVELTTALKKYFFRKLDLTEIAKKIITFLKNPDNPKTRKKLQLTLNRINTPAYRFLENKHFDRLQNSTILAVWTLVPERMPSRDEEEYGFYPEPPIQNQMIGLAKDNKTGKLFHWTTDLGKDVSVLMQYASENDE